MFSRRIGWIVLLFFAAPTLRSELRPDLVGGGGIGYNVPHLSLLYLRRKWDINPHDLSSAHSRALVRLNDRFAQKISYDLAYQQVVHVRVGVTGYSTADIVDWVDPASRDWYWQRMDMMIATLGESHVKLVPGFIWNADQFPSLARAEGVADNARDMVANPASRSRTLLQAYVVEFVNRYAKTGVIAFYELGGELNLQADLPWGWKTQELMEFSQWFVRTIKSADPEVKVSSGFAIPHYNAEHLRMNIEGRDTLAELERNFKLIHEPFDITSLHIYNSPDPLDQQEIPDNERFGFIGTELIKFFAYWSGDTGKPLYLGEFGDYHPTTVDGKRHDGFTFRVIEEIASMPNVIPAVWVYQFNEHNPWEPKKLSFEPGTTTLLTGAICWRNRFARASTIPLQQIAAPPPPQVIITDPLNDQIVSEYNPSIKAVASDYDIRTGFVPAEIGLWIDDVFVGSQVRPPYEFRLIPLAWAKGMNLVGRHTFRVVAKTTDGREATDEVRVELTPQAFVPPITSTWTLPR